MIIREVRAADFEEWRELFLAYGEFYETTFSDQILEGVWAWLLSDQHPLHGFVANDRGRIVGFAHLQRQWDTFEAGAAWFLDDLYVLPEARGAGIATALIEHARHHATTEGGGTMRWITAATNQTAMKVYDRLAKRTSWVMYEMDERESLS